MSDPLFPLSEEGRRLQGRRRARSSSSSPRDRPSSLPRKEGCGAEEPPPGRGSLVLTTSGLNVGPPAPLAKSQTRSLSRPNAAWAIPSAGRCVACDRLTCECRSARPDRAVVRQKLESLRMNTPYERAKLLRLTEEGRTEESRRRRRLGDAWMGGLLQIQAQELAERLVALLVQKERRRRGDIAAQEERHRAAVSRALDTHRVLAALGVHERQGRAAVAALEQEAHHQLLAHARLLDVLGLLLHKERCGRSTIECNEGAGRGAVLATVANVRHQQRAREEARVELSRRCEAAREAIVCEWAAALDSAAAVRAADQQRIAGWMEVRAALVVGALRSAKELEREEAHDRHRLLDEMREDGETVVERVRLFARACQGLERTEAAARQGIAEAASSALHGLALEFTSEAEDVAAMAAMKLRRQAAEMQTALTLLRGIADEEADAFEELLSAEARERDQRWEWVAAKAAERAQFMKRAVAAMMDVAGAEEEAWKGLVRALEQSQMDAEERVAGRHRQCLQLWAAAVEEKEAMSQDEHRCRFRLISAMGEDEESLRRWCAARVRAVEAFVDGEAADRAALHSAEETARDRLRMARDAGADAIDRRARDTQAALHGVQQSCLHARRTLEGEESEAFVALAHHAALEWTRVVAAAQFRAQLHLQQEESHRRALLAQEEAAERGAQRATMELADRFLAEEAQHRLHAVVAEVLSEEQTARVVIVRAIESGYQRLYTQEREAQLQAIRLTEARLEAEIRAAEQCMEEDARLYAQQCEDELLPGQTEGPRSVAGPADATRTLKMQLVLQALGLDGGEGVAGGEPPSWLSAGAPLSGSAVDCLVHIVDALNTRRAEAAEQLAIRERAARDAARRLAQQEQVLANEREKKEANAARLQRDTDDQQRRLQNDKAEKQRGQQQCETEQRRLQDTLALLQERKDALEDLKGSINKQYGRA